MQQYYTLGDVVRILGLKPHVVTYAITSGQLPEPPVRVGNKRVFTEEDVERMALHFRVTPRWPSCDSTSMAEPRQRRPMGLVLKPPYSVENAGDSGHEVRDGEGNVFALAADRAKALVIAGLLESAVRG